MTGLGAGGIDYYIVKQLLKSLLVLVLYQKEDNYDKPE